MDDGGGHTQNFSIPGIRHVALVIEQNGIKQRWYHAVIDHLQVISFLHIDVHELQDFFLDRTETTHFWRLSCNITYTRLVSTISSWANLLSPPEATESEINWLEARYMLSMS